MKKVFILVAWVFLSVLSTAALTVAWLITQVKSKKSTKKPYFAIRSIIDVKEE